MSIVPPTSIDTVSIEPTIDRYFTSLNDRDFKTTTELFAELGCLKPPFDRPIQGREQLTSVEIKLLASLPELLNIDRDRAN